MYLSKDTYNHRFKAFRIQPVAIMDENEIVNYFLSMQNTYRSFYLMDEIGKDEKEIVGIPLSRTTYAFVKFQNSKKKSMDFFSNNGTRKKELTPQESEMLDLVLGE